MYIKPKICIDFDSHEGNVFHIIALARNTIKSCCIFNTEEKLKKFDNKIEEAKNGDYYQVLDAIRKFVEIIET